MLKNPVRTILSIIEKEGVSDFSASAPWGRSWRCGNAPSRPENATSVQVHVRVKYTSLQRVMAVSGILAVYVTPKDDDRGLLTGWAIVWLRKPKPEILVDITKMGTEHCGIIRSNKGLGVRIAKANFPKAFAELRPHDKAPSALEAKMLFRLQPTPLGATAEVIEEITKMHKWETRATKSLGPDAWMIATETEPPVQWLSVNGSVILVKPMEAAKQRPKPLVLAGNVSVVQSNVTNAKPEDPWVKDVMNDPWAKWNSSRTQMTTPLMPNPAQDSSIAKKLQEQDDKMKHLEQQVGKLTTLYKETTDVQVKYQKENDQKMAKIKDDLKEQMSQVSSSFQSSLDRALAKHDENIGQQFRELKDLFMPANPISSPNAPSAKYR